MKKNVSFASIGIQYLQKISKHYVNFLGIKDISVQEIEKTLYIVSIRLILLYKESENKSHLQSETDTWKSTIPFLSVHNTKSTAHRNPEESSEIWKPLPYFIEKISIPNELWRKWRTWLSSSDWDGWNLGWYHQEAMRFLHKQILRTSIKREQH